MYKYLNLCKNSFTFFSSNGVKKNHLEEKLGEVKYFVTHSIAFIIKEF